MTDSVFLSPKSIAIIGASDKEGSVGRAITSNIMKGYKGTIYPISPTRETVFDKKAYKSVLDVPGKIDLAVIVTKNTIVPTVVGQRWYLSKALSTGVDTDFDSVNWDMFTLVDTNSPYTNNKLAFTTLTTWRANYAEAEEESARTANYGVPVRVIRSSDGRRFGLSPIPDKIYNIHFFAYDRPAALSADTDTVLFPEQYKPVLLARARYYIYQFKDNIAQSQLALDEYKKGLQSMADNLNSPQPSYMSDVRFTYLLP